ncbi:MAG: hypothetical protein SNJ64_07120 [Endomicrobiia bacterium]
MNLFRLILFVFSLIITIHCYSQENESGASEQQDEKKDKKEEVDIPKMESKARQSRTREDLIRDVGKSKSYNKKKDGRQLTKEQRKNRREYKKLRKKQQQAKTTRRMRKNDRIANKNNSEKKEPLPRRVWKGITNITIDLQLKERWYRLTNKNHRKPSEPPKKKKQGKRKLRFKENDTLGEKKRRR